MLYDREGKGESGHRGSEPRASTHGARLIVPSHVDRSDDADAGVRRPRPCVQHLPTTTDSIQHTPVCPVTHTCTNSKPGCSFVFNGLEMKVHNEFVLIDTVITSVTIVVVLTLVRLKPSKKTNFFALMHVSSKNCVRIAKIYYEYLGTFEMLDRSSPISKTKS